MNATYQDYYKTIGLDRSASPDDIQKAYRKLARKFHPDVNKDAGAEDQFKKISEAYEVLKDPEKRSLYDQLGQNWKAGQTFNRPQDFANGGNYRFTNTGGFEFGDFSEFFSNLFGGGATFSSSSFEGFDPRNMQGRQQASKNQEAEISVSLEEAFHGTTKRLSIESSDLNNQGSPTRIVKTLDVKIPKGTIDSSKIRLSGQGSGGGDLILKIKVQPGKNFNLEGSNLLTKVKVTPWEAALGASIPVSTLDGEINLQLKPGTQAGSRLRVKGKGFSLASNARGDLIVEITIAVPRSIGEQEKKLMEELSSISSFNPRIGD